MSEEKSTKHRRAIRDSFFANLVFDDSGPASPEKVLERLESARLQATKEANRLLIISFLFCGLYLIKASGLRVDLVLFDQKIFEVPYGICFFCIIAQISFCMNCIRSLDARIYDRYLKRACELKWPVMSDDVYQTFPNQAAWSEGAIGALSRIKNRDVAKGCLSVLMLPSLLLILTMLLAPTAAGLYYLIDWQRQISTGNIAIQYYSVMFSTTITIIWFAQYCAIHGMDQEQ